MLGRAIEALPGRKLILTNGSRQHAENVAGKLGIRDHFEEIFDIVAADFVPKPEARTYETLPRRVHGVDPSRAAMFEDLAKNLVVPHAIGMTTILVLPADVGPVPRGRRAGRRRGALYRSFDDRPDGLPCNEASCRRDAGAGAKL